MIVSSQICSPQLISGWIWVLGGGVCGWLLPFCGRAELYGHCFDTSDLHMQPQCVQASKSAEPGTVHHIHQIQIRINRYKAKDIGRLEDLILKFVGSSSGNKLFPDETNAHLCNCVSFWVCRWGTAVKESVAAPLLLALHARRNVHLALSSIFFWKHFCVTQVWSAVVRFNQVWLNGSNDIVIQHSAVRLYARYCYSELLCRDLDPKHLFVRLERISFDIEMIQTTN